MIPQVGETWSRTTLLHYTVKIIRLNPLANIVVYQHRPGDLCNRRTLKVFLELFSKVEP